MGEVLDSVVPAPEKGLLDLFGGLLVDHEALGEVRFAVGFRDPAVALVLCDVVPEEGLRGRVGLGWTVGLVLVVVLQDLLDTGDSGFECLCHCGSLSERTRECNPAVTGEGGVDFEGRELAGADCFVGFGGVEQVFEELDAVLLLVDGFDEGSDGTGEDEVFVGHGWSLSWFTKGGNRYAKYFLAILKSWVVLSSTERPQKFRHFEPHTQSVAPLTPSVKSPPPLLASTRLVTKIESENELNDIQQSIKTCNDTLDSHT